MSSVNLSHGSWRVERSVRLRRESTWVKLSWRMASSIMVRERSPFKELWYYLDLLDMDHGNIMVLFGTFLRCYVNVNIVNTMGISLDPGMCKIHIFLKSNSWLVA